MIGTKSKAGSAREDAASSPVSIRAELADLAVPLDEVQPYPGNPRRGDLTAITESLIEHGQYAAVLVQDSTGWIVKGNNTWLAMADLGATHVAAQRLELTEDQARKILAIDNRTSDKATYDDRELAALLAGIDDLAGSGWSQSEVDALLRATDHLGDQATDFLNDALNPAPSADEASAAAAAAEPQESEPVAATNAAGASVEYVTMAFTVSPAHRDTIRAALRAVQSAESVDTAAGALLTLCRRYLDETGEATT